MKQYDIDKDLAYFKAKCIGFNREKDDPNAGGLLDYAIELEPDNSGDKQELLWEHLWDLIDGM